MAAGWSVCSAFRGVQGAFRGVQGCLDVASSQQQWISLVGVSWLMHTETLGKETILAVGT
jgi:hypothetical protein